METSLCALRPHTQNFSHCVVGFPIWFPYLSLHMENNTSNWREHSMWRLVFGSWRWGFPCGGLNTWLHVKWPFRGGKEKTQCLHLLKLSGRQRLKPWKQKVIFHQQSFICIYVLLFLTFIQNIKRTNHRRKTVQRDVWFFQASNPRLFVISGRKSFSGLTDFCLSWTQKNNDLLRAKKSLPKQ